jgi:hypothetical protein
MNALKPIAPQLSKLVRMLSSSHDSEIVATARAIDRVLRSHRLDWHDLAQAICLPALAIHPCDDADWRDLLAFCASRMNCLNSREREFLRSIAHWRGNLTERQRLWLEAIADKSRNARWLRT